MVVAIAGWVVGASVVVAAPGWVVASAAGLVVSAPAVIGPFVFDALSFRLPVPLAAVAFNEALLALAVACCKETLVEAFPITNT